MFTTELAKQYVSIRLSKQENVANVRSTEISFSALWYKYLIIKLKSYAYATTHPPGPLLAHLSSVVDVEKTWKNNNECVMLSLIAKVGYLAIDLWKWNLLAVVLKVVVYETWLKATKENKESDNP